MATITTGPIGHIGRQCRKVIREDERIRIVGVSKTAGSLIAGAEKTIRIMRETLARWRRFNLPVPRPLRALRRDQYPLPRKGIVSSVRMSVWLEGHGAS